MHQRQPEQSKEFLAKPQIHEAWECNYLSPGLDGFYNAAFARIVEELGDTAGKNILDLGCGYCYHTQRLAASGLSIIAADFSESALVRARETLAKAGLEHRVELRQADATKLPFPDASFDNVLIWGVLMHIPEAEKALLQAARVLKPGGKLVLAENNAHSLDVVFVERLINFIKLMIGRKPHERHRARLGIEEWQRAETGGLMVRKTDMAALAKFCDGLGLDLDKRFAGQFTEIYTRVKAPGIKRAIQSFNQFYFQKVGLPGPSMGNILIFRKRPASQG
jgi:ubiquinone/menaquinone biosynthesis C-methylase UbiE